MGIARSLLLRASRSSWLAAQFSRRAFARRALRRFMPGEHVEDALAAARRLEQEGHGTVLTQLGENLTSLAEAEAVHDHYAALLETVRDRRLPTHISVKPTQLGLDLSSDACGRHLDSLAQLAAAAGSFLWIDMEDSSYVDRTLDLYRDLRSRHERVGVCLQAYLRRTPADLASLLPLLPAIRLVKGAYAEPAALAFPAKREVDQAFARLGRTMLEASARSRSLSVFGTHDLQLIAMLRAIAADLAVPDGCLEVHMLYGIRSADQQRLARNGLKVRTLISYGQHWFPWYVRRLAERPANVWFVVRALLG